MKYINKGHIIELTARNVTALLAKLDDRASTRMLVAPTGDVVVQAVEDDTVRGNETAIRTAESNGIMALTRDELWRLARPGTTVMVAGFGRSPIVGPPDLSPLFRATIMRVEGSS